jgi:nucleotide-binding universal stress UspA family protein
MKRTVILVALDRTKTTDHVLETAKSVAQSTPGAELHLFHGVDTGNPPGVTQIPLDETMLAASTFLDESAQRIAQGFAGRIASHLTQADPVRQLLQLATDLRADLIIVGSHGKNLLERVMLGSFSQAVVNKAPCAVLVARPNAYAAVPEIEPPCPACLEVQQATHGEKLWCAQHASRHAHGRLHYQFPEPFAVGSSLIRPES